MGRKRIFAGVGESGSQREDDPRFVTALARGIQLLRVFRSQDRWLGHRELVSRTGLPGATVSRITFTLASLGYLAHRPESGEYALSPAVLGLGFSMLSNFEIGRIARPTLQGLAEKCQAAVSLGARHQMEMVYMAHCRSTQRLLLGLDVGARIPLAQTSMGLAVLFHLPGVERNLLLQQIASTEAGGRTALDQRLARAQAQYSALGFVTTEGEWDPMISAAAVPVDVGDGRNVFGLSVGGPSTWLKGSFLHEEIGPMLIRAAATIVADIHAAEWKY